MSPEYSGVLDFWEKTQRERGNEAGAEMARVLREQYGDLIRPSQTTLPVGIGLRSAVLPPERSIHPKLREVLSGIKFTFLYPRSKEFLLKAIAENAFAGISVRNRNIFGTYYISRASHTEVGNIYGISGERVRQICSDVINEIWLSTPDSLKEQYPRNTIHFKKSVDNLPPEWLLVQDNLGSQIIEALEQGLSEDQIKLRYAPGYKRAQTIKALKLLRDMGFKVGFLPYTHGEALRIQQQLLKPNLSDQETQSLLDQINTMSSVELLFSSGTIISVLGLLRSAGFHFSVQQQLFWEAIKDAGIPASTAEEIILSGPQKGKRYYHFIARRDQQRAKKALLENPDLAKFLENPVKQISGPESKIPNTTLIMAKRGVVSFLSILSEFGIGHIGKRRMELEEAVKNSNQVPLFKYKRILYLWEADAQNLRSFITQELAKGAGYLA